MRFLLIFILMFLSSQLFAQNKIISLFVYQFAKNTETEQSIFILNNIEIYNELSKSNKISVKLIKDIEKCPIIFIGNYKLSNKELNILSNTLIIGYDNSGYTHINIIKVNDNIKFEIYLSNLSKNSIKVSSQIVTLGIIKK